MNNILTSQLSESVPKPKQQKMLTFLDELHHRYKVLSKLSQKQLQDFQNEIILLLVDQNENVDSHAYEDMMNNIGIDVFVLQILAKCINKNTFNNTYELKKNINSIVVDFQKQNKEISKKNKILERKQLEFNKNQSNLKNKIKQYAQGIEKQCINRLISKENQIKKNIGNLLNNLKGKEKILNERKQQILRKLNEIEIKQRNLVNLQKQHQNKKKQQPHSEPNIEQPQQQSTSNSDPLANPTKQLKQLSKKNNEIKSQLEKVKKKFKTTQMAYNKIKNDLIQKQKDNQILREKIEFIQQQWKIDKDKYHQQVKNQKDKLGKFQKNCFIQELDGKDSTIKNTSRKLKNNKDKQEKIQKDSHNTDDDHQQHQLIEMLQMLQISNIQGQSQFKEKINITNNIPEQPMIAKSKQQQQKNPSSLKQFINAKRSKLMNNGDKNSANNIKQNQNKNEQQIQIVSSDRENCSEDEKKNCFEQRNNNINIDIRYKQRRNNIYTLNNHIQSNNNNNKQDKQKTEKMQLQNKNKDIGIKNQKVQQSQIDGQQQRQQQKCYEESQQSISTQNFIQNIKQSIAKEQNLQSAPQIIQKIMDILSSSPHQKSIPILLQSNLLKKFIKLPSFEYTKKNVMKFLDILLLLVEQSSPHYYQSIQYIGSQQFTSTFQKYYLNYQTNLQISEITTLLISRVLMVTRMEIKFCSQFVNAIKLRDKTINSTSGNDGEVRCNEELLKGNIQCLLSMIYV